MIKQAHIQTALVRYGRVPEVARFEASDDIAVTHGAAIVVQTHRGLQLGEFLETVRGEPDIDRPQVVRLASDKDLIQHQELASRCDDVFDKWVERIESWDLDLQLVDLEWTLDGEKLIFYVLNERGPDCTKLALQAAAGGFGLIEVQPVDENGPVSLPNASGGG